MALPTLNIWRFSTPLSLHPIWVSSLRGGVVVLRADNCRTVTAKGELLTLLPNEPDLPTNEPLYITCTNWLHCETVAGREQRLAMEKKQQEEKEAAYKAKLVAQAEADKAFNERLKIPVRWGLAIRPVMSGLSENSFGNGERRSTVAHIKLLEPLVSGRLKRDANDFLCSTYTGKAITGSNDIPDGRVSCKACLALAHKHWGA